MIRESFPTVPGSRFAIHEPKKFVRERARDLPQQMLSKLSGQAERAISTAQLNALLRLHMPPINQVFFLGPSYLPIAREIGRPYLGAGFLLRCFQRLSLPDFATQRCPWRDNWYTRGRSTSVLSYWRQTPASLLRPHQIGTELSCDVLNPAHVPL